MKPGELRQSLFAERHERPTDAPHTLLCLTCGNLEEFEASTCSEGASYFLPPSMLEDLAQLSDELGAGREDVLRGLLAVALAALERGGITAHTRAVAFLRDLEEAEAEADDPAPESGPRGLVQREPASSTSKT